MRALGRRVPGSREHLKAFLTAWLRRMQAFRTVVMDMNGAYSADIRVACSDAKVVTTVPCDDGIHLGMHRTGLLCRSQKCRVR